MLTLFISQLVVSFTQLCKSVLGMLFFFSNFSYVKNSLIEPLLKFNRVIHWFDNSRVYVDQGSGSAIVAIDVGTPISVQSADYQQTILRVRQLCQTSLIF